MYVIKKFILLVITIIARRNAQLKHYIPLSEKIAQVHFEINITFAF